MTAAQPATQLTRRDQALLAAVAAGRGKLTGGIHPGLLIDGQRVCDQLAASQLIDNGFVRRAGREGQLYRAELTPEGAAALRQAQNNS